jgi:hypothetical protein
MRCLVIEDEADTARYVCNGLKEAGFALFGISVMGGTIIIAYFNQMIDSGLERSAAIHLRGGLRGPIASSRFDRHRIPSPEAARACRRRRHSGGASSYAYHPAGPH